MFSFLARNGHADFENPKWGGGAKTKTSVVDYTYSTGTEIRYKVVYLIILWNVGINC